MKFLLDGEVVLNCSPYSAITGHRIDTVQLNVTDFLRLRQMQPEHLELWVGEVLKRFSPPANDPRGAVQSTAP